MTKPITICSYNVGSCKDLAKMERAYNLNQSEEEQRALVERFNKISKSAAEALLALPNCPTVFLLQEASAKHPFVETLAQHGYEAFFQKQNSKEIPYDSTSVVAMKKGHFTKVEDRSFNVIASDKSEKGVAMVKACDTQGHSLTFTSIHLPGCDLDDPQQEDLRWAKEEAVEIVTHIEQSDADVAICGGDTNITPDFNKTISSTDERVTTFVNKNFWQFVVQQPTNFYPRQEGSSRRIQIEKRELDTFFVKGTFSASIVPCNALDPQTDPSAELNCDPTKNGSDHRPILIAVTPSRSKVAKAKLKAAALFASLLAFLALGLLLFRRRSSPPQP